MNDWGAASSQYPGYTKTSTNLVRTQEKFLPIWGLDFFYLRRKKIRKHICFLMVGFSFILSLKCSLRISLSPHRYSLHMGVYLSLHTYICFFFISHTAHTCTRHTQRTHTHTHFTHILHSSLSSISLCSSTQLPLYTANAPLTAKLWTSIFCIFRAWPILITQDKSQFSEARDVILTGQWVTLGHAHSLNG